MGKNPARAKIGLAKERLNGCFFAKNAHTPQVFEVGDGMARVSLPRGDWTSPRACNEGVCQQLPLEVEESGQIKICREGNTLHIKLIQGAVSAGNDR
jgi:hypothetical protein